MATKRARSRTPRSPDNPMAILACKVLTEAEAAFKTADKLAAGMEPHLGKLYSNSAIYSYVNEWSVPPGDVLLAAVLASSISLDEKLGIARKQTETEHQVEELRAEMARLRNEMTRLQERLAGRDGAPADQQPADAKSSAPEREAERRRWARRSAAAQPPTPSAPAGRRTGRDRAV